MVVTEGVVPVGAAAAVVMEGVPVGAVDQVVVMEGVVPVGVAAVGVAMVPPPVVEEAVDIRDKFFHFLDTFLVTCAIAIASTLD